MSAGEKSFFLKKGWQRFAEADRNLVIASLRLQYRELSGRPISPERLRWRKIPFYPGLQLVRLKGAGQQKTLPAYFVLDPVSGELLYLDGQSEIIHRLNRQHGLVLGQQTVLQYLRFFCFMVHGSEGAFLIVDSLENPMIAGLPCEEVIRRYSTEFTLETADGYWKSSALVLYGKHLFRAGFLVWASGVIEMTDDEPLTALEKGNDLLRRMPQLTPLRNDDSHGGKTLFAGGSAMARDDEVGDPDYRVTFISPEHLREQQLQAEGDAARQQMLGGYIQKFEPCSGRLPLMRVATGLDEGLARLECHYPNFQAVIDFVREELTMSRLLSGGVIELPAMVLEGPPGVGKTRFLHDLAETLQLHFECIDVASASAGFELGGASGVWRGGRPGRVVDAIYQSGQANPMILLDEIDQISDNRNYPVDGPLYSLLERFTAKAFMDEYLRVRSDCSHINWFATCNRLARLPAPIRSRLFHFEIRPPSSDQCTRVIQSVYRDVLAENRWGGAFVAELEEDVLEYLAEKESSPRVIKRILRQAAVNAALRCSRQDSSDEQQPMCNIVISVFDLGARGRDRVEDDVARPDFRM